MRHHDAIERRPITIERNGTTTTWALEDAPTGLLIYRLLHLRIVSSQAMQDQRDAALELERRRRENGETFSGYIAAKLAAFISPPCCICGGKGIYIVGRQTYCSMHKNDARAHLSKTRGTSCASKQREYEQEQQRFDRILRRHDSLRSSRVARNKR